MTSLHIHGDNVSQAARVLEADAACDTIGAECRCCVSRRDGERLGLRIYSKDSTVMPRVVAVTPNGPAARGGMRNGDTIVSVFYDFSIFEIVYRSRLLL